MSSLSEPEKLGKYQILSLIGRGSMGVVYKALDPEIGRTVALKMMRGVRTPNSVGGTSARTLALYSEARSAGSLRHQNIITVFDISVDENNPYIVMDYVDGVGLDKLIKDKKLLSPELAICYLAQAASGLDYAHSKSIVHCDVKPSNLLIDSSNHLFILDFGIAKLITSDSSDPEDQVVGTPAYMSPEQINSEKITSKTDIFSLAIVTFEALTGFRPFKGNEFSVVLGNILNGKRESITDLNPNLPLTLEAIFDSALDIEPRNRYNDCSSFILSVADALGLENPFLKLGVIPEKKIIGFFQLRNLQVKIRQRVKGLANDTSIELSKASESLQRIRLVVLSVIATVISICLLTFYVILNRKINELSKFTDQSIIPSYFELINPELPEVAKDFTNKTTQELITIVAEAKHGNSFNCFMAIRELKIRGSIELALFLKQILNHPSQRIRMIGLEYLESLGGVKEYNYLVVNLLNDPNPYIREKAINSLKTIKDKNTVLDIALKAYSEKDPATAKRLNNIVNFVMSE
jgi:serine/threonine protein kinase